MPLANEAPLAAEDIRDRRGKDSRRHLPDPVDIRSIPTTSDAPQQMKRYPPRIHAPLPVPLGPEPGTRREPVYEPLCHSLPVMPYPVSPPLRHPEVVPLHLHGRIQIRLRQGFMVEVPIGVEPRALNSANNEYICKLLRAPYYRKGPGRNPYNPLSIYKAQILRWLL